MQAMSFPTEINTDMLTLPLRFPLHSAGLLTLKEHYSY